MHKPTRRTLLRSIAAAAGSAGVYRTMDALGMLGPATAHAAALDLPHGSGEGGRVVILGAGISGLAAALEMSRAGWDRTILEASRRPGGRNLTAARRKRTWGMRPAWPMQDRPHSLFAKGIPCRHCSRTTVGRDVEETA